MVYKCKICGGSLDISAEQSVCECEYCGTKQTLPKMNDEQKNNLLERAEHYRFIKDFDKAAVMYDQVLSFDNTDADTYWSILLCRYGIEYVKDPASGNRKPTINRMQADSFLTDKDYKSVLKYANPAQKEIYEEQAKEIADIQDEIRMIADKEEPYDIFISYKEKTDEGGRTKSSVLAQDLYDRLQKEGYRVFFSRISLEDKIGEKYEPYIYSALITAKVMLLVGTEKSEFTATWVKNEWSRFLSMMKTDKDKRLIPCFRDMDVYDIPDELQFLQCQDMSKVGFEQDLLQGIKKILVKTDNEKSVLNKRNEDPEKQMIHNAEVLFSLENYPQARAAFEEITLLYPENYKGWWGLLLCETDNLTRTSVNRGRIRELYGYVEKLVDRDQLKEIQEKYIDYWEILSKLEAKEEIENVNKEISIENEKIKEVKKCINEKQNEIKELKAQCKNIQDDLELKKEKLKIFKARKNKTTLSFVIAIGACIADFILGMTIIWVVVFLGAIIFGIYSSVQTSKMRPEMRFFTDEYIESENESIKGREELISSISNEIEKLNKSMEPHMSAISELSEYTELGIYRIAELLLEIKKKELHMEYNINQNDDVLREKTMALLKKRI